jgi:hypothetical protein
LQWRVTHIVYRYDVDWSMTAPVASGWSGCRVGLAPSGKRRLVTAHTLSGRSSGKVRTKSC